jgi:DNA-binding response OmpR family regulator
MESEVKKMQRMTSDGVEILIAEDSLTQAEQLKYLLEEQGYRVTVAANGKKALDLVRTRKPRLIISDIMMPEMDGYTLCRTIKSDAATKDIPVILLTSFSSPDDVIKVLDSNADNFIRKPYDEKYLFSRVRYILTNRELPKTDNQIGIEIFFGGKRHFITAGRQQILNLLVSMYEGTVQVSEELNAREKDLEKANAEMKVMQGKLEQVQAKYRTLLTSKRPGGQ